MFLTRLENDWRQEYEEEHSGGEALCALDVFSREEAKDEADDGAEEHNRQRLGEVVALDLRRR
jgi:hypothetical protein